MSTHHETDRAGSFHLAVLIHAAIFVGLVLILGLLDLSLQLGMFQGLVFLIYLAYGAAAQALLGLVAAFWLQRRRRHALPWAISAVVIPALGYGLIYGLAWLAGG